MSKDRAYTSSNKIRFTEIPDKIGRGNSKFPVLTSIYSEIVQTAISTFQNTRKFKQDVVDSINITTYIVLVDRNTRVKLNADALDINNYPDLEDAIDKWYLTIDSIDWNIESTASEVGQAPDTKPVEQQIVESTSTPDPRVVPVDLPVVPITEPQKPAPVKKAVKPTPKTNLYIQCPSYPQFDINSLWKVGYDKDNNKMIGIYKSLPEIPRCQQEVSCTTEPGKMSRDDLLKLFPNHFIPTRQQELYVSIDGYELEYDPLLGAILPIGDGKYTREQLIDNIIKYPHLFQVNRDYSNTGIVSKYPDDGFIQPIYSYIEIDGKLYSTSEIWDSLPDTKKIPPNSKYMKEYVVRRYLLERDIDGIEHKYPMIGDLRPYLTLFMPPEQYLERGHITDLQDSAAALARKCVEARVAYHQSVNPMIKRIEKEPEIPQGKPVRDPCIFSAYCINKTCNESCIDYVQSDYLLKRNNISPQSKVFATDYRKISKFSRILSQNEGTMCTYIEKNDTSATAELFAYVSVCNTWRYSVLKCKTYTWNYFRYLDLVKKSYNAGESTELEYMNIWIDSAKVLIVCNLDFVRFNDFSCQELLGKLERRRFNPELTTIVVCPPISSLVGEGPFFPKLTNYLSRVITE